MIKINRNKCDLCGACVGVCPENVMNISPTQLTIDRMNCTLCSKCVWICPVRALCLFEDKVTNSSTQLFT